MATKAEKAKAEISRAVHKAWRRWVENLLKVSKEHGDGTVTISRFHVDQMKDYIRADYDDLPELKIIADNAEADRIIEAIDGKELEL